MNWLEVSEALLNPSLELSGWSATERRFKLWHVTGISIKLLVIHSPIKAANITLRSYGTQYLLSQLSDGREACWDEDSLNILTRRFVSLQWRTPCEPCVSMAGSGSRWTHPGDVIKENYNISFHIPIASTFLHLKKLLFLTWKQSLNISVKISPGKYASVRKTDISVWCG